MPRIKVIVLTAFGLIFICLLFFVLKIFKSNNDTIATIPRNSLAVAKLDLIAILENAEISKWQDLEMFNNDWSEKIGQEIKLIGKTYHNIEKSGIDIKKCVYAFYGESVESYGGLSMALSDPECFEQTIRSIDSEIEVGYINGILTAVLIPNEVVVIWDEEVAMFFSSRNNDILDKAIMVFSQQNENSMLNDDAFMSFETENCDLGIFMASSISESRFFKNHASRLNKLHGLALLCNFEKSKFIAETRFYPKPGIDDAELNFIDENNFSDDISNFLSEKNPIGFFAININEKNFLDAVDLSQMIFGDDFISGEEFEEAFTGEIFVSVNDFRKVSSYYTINTLENRRVRRNNDYGNYWYGYQSNYSSYTWRDEPTWVSRRIKKTEPVVFFRTVLKVRNQSKAQAIINQLIDYGVGISEYKFDNGYLKITNDDYVDVISKDRFVSSEFIKNNKACAKIDLDLEHYADLKKDFKYEIQNHLCFLNLLDSATISTKNDNFLIEINFKEDPEHMLWRIMKAVNEEVIGSGNK
jgi:hypothetical protein